jgi:formylglycine-generating enzyme required for sulfatase activity
MSFSWANNLRLDQLTWLSSQRLSVEVSWDNSWRNGSGPEPEFHDVVWVFGKWRVPGGVWQHLNLSSDAADFSSAVALEPKAVSDGMGVFVRRADPGMGSIAGSLLEIALAQPLPGGPLEIELFGLEMVYVPEGPFFLGDSSGFHHFRTASDGSPFWVDSEGSISQSELSVGDEASLGGDLPLPYPKGFAAFYAMKYELSQAQYRDFLNSLSYAQQVNRTHNSPDGPVGSYALASFAGNPQRNGLVLGSPGSAPDQSARYACDAQSDGQFDQADDGQHRACNFLSWGDLLAYLDWAGLRPLTELEYEKACRGPEVPIPGGFAWGTALAVDANSLVDDGLPSESVSEGATASAGLASHGYAGPQGPLRGGFGGKATGDRLQIGGSYYGLLELSGNIWEQCVGVDSLGLLFERTLGDGALDPDGSANVPSWSPQAGRYRGGGFNSGIVGEFRDLAVSDRFYHDLVAGQRRGTSGGRGGR